MTEEITNTFLQEYIHRLGVPKDAVVTQFNSYVSHGDREFRVTVVVEDVDLAAEATNPPIRCKSHKG